MTSPINALDAIKYAQWLSKDVWHAIEAEKSHRDYQDYLEQVEEEGIQYDIKFTSPEMQVIEDRIDKMGQLHALLMWYADGARSSLVYIDRPMTEDNPHV